MVNGLFKSKYTTAIQNRVVPNIASLLCKNNDDSGIGGKELLTIESSGGHKVCHRRDTHSLNPSGVKGIQALWITGL